MALLWESGPVSLGAGKSGRYGTTMTRQPSGAVNVTAKIVAGAGHPADLKLVVSNFEITRSKSGKYGYWVRIKNSSRADISFKLQVYKLK